MQKPLKECPVCGEQMVKLKARASGAGSCLLELIGVVVVVLSLKTDWKTAGFIIGGAFIVLGHKAAYQTRLHCKACGHELLPD